MMKNKKLRAVICLFFAVILTALSPSGVLAAVSSEPVSWYTRPTANGIRPSLPPEAPFLSEHNAVALGPDEKVVYLTFDAGYENGNVEKIVTSLEKHKATAAFFVLSGLVDDAPELVKRMHKNGYLICNHTNKHRDMTQFTDFKNFREELVSMESYFSEKMGFALDKFYRPPEGKFSEQNLAWADELGYKTVFWSLAYADWDNDNQPDPEKSLSLIMSRMHNGAVILLHPTSATNAAILDELLTKLEKEGYRFGSLSELK